MSRSFKHTPYCGDKKSKFFKRYANRKLRRKKFEHNLQNKSYRKDFCYYDICDYYTIETDNFEIYYLKQIELWQKWRAWGDDIPYPTREECWKEYHKWYIRK